MLDLILPHFLRPDFLYLYLALPFVWWLLKRGATQDNSWTKHIDSTLLEAIQGGTLEVGKKTKQPSRAIGVIIFALLIFALSGPSWKQTKTPSVQPSDNAVVILDLSLSMMAEDTAPSRLVRAKQKIIDLLKLRSGGSTALIAFSGDSFVVTPLTDDTNTIEANLKALAPLIMPVIGSRPDLAVTQAVSVMEDAGFNQGRIFLFTDGVAEHHSKRITETLNSKLFSLDIIGVGTELGGPIKLPDGRGYLKDKGSVVIPKLEMAQLTSLATSHRGQAERLSLDSSDLLNLRADDLSTELNPELNEREFDQWQDMGYIFLAIALPIILLAYRQGALLLVLIFILPDEASAFSTDTLWKSNDQQAQELYESGDFEGAAEQFESPLHKADA
ncbi:VWA domain-containing protein, partial [Oleiphilus sp. HI0067]